MAHSHYSVEWCRRKGFTDSSRCLKGLDHWRQYWRPKKVKILLIAESHVRELKSDDQVHVKRLKYLRKSSPNIYVRLIYCLGYGENSLCEGNPKQNRGTPQFWKLFKAIADRRIQVKSLPPPTGIDEKVSILRNLRGRGIWLVDASIGALTKPGSTRKDRRIKIRNRRTTIKQGFETYVWPMVRRDIPLKQIWIIGIGVGKALRKADLKGLRNGVSDRRIIRQPNGQNQREYHRDLERLLRGVARW